MMYIAEDDVIHSLLFHFVNTYLVLVCQNGVLDIVLYHSAHECKCESVD